MENAGEVIVVAQDGMLRFINSRATEYSDYSAEELTSNPFIQIVHPEDRDEVRKNYINRVNREAAPARYTIRVMRKDNSIRWVQVSSVRIFWEGAPATLNFLSDITEKRRLEEELVNVRKLESMGGKETVDRLHQMDAGVKAIVSSGYSNDPIMSDYQKHGFSGVVAKPYNMRSLGNALAGLLAKVQDIT